MALFKIEFTNMLTEVTSTATIEVEEWILEGEDYSLDSIKMIFN